MSETVGKIKNQEIPARLEETSEQIEWDQKKKRLNRFYSISTFVLSTVYAGASWFIFSGFMQLTTSISKSLGSEMSVPGEIALALVAIILILIGGILLMFITDKIFLSHRLKLGKRP
jgi:preprotein translocase subunit SecY